MIKCLSVLCIIVVGFSCAFSDEVYDEESPSFFYSEGGVEDVEENILDTKASLVLALSKIGNKVYCCKAGVANYNLLPYDKDFAKKNEVILSSFAPLNCSERHPAVKAAIADNVLTVEASSANGFAENKVLITITYTPIDADPISTKVVASKYYAGYDSLSEDVLIDNDNVDIDTFFVLHQARLISEDWLFGVGIHQSKSIFQRKVLKLVCVDDETVHALKLRDVIKSLKPNKSQIPDASWCWLYDLAFEEVKNSKTDRRKSTILKFMAEDPDLPPAYVDPLIEKALELNEYEDAHQPLPSRKERGDTTYDRCESNFNMQTLRSTLLPRIKSRVLIALGQTQALSADQIKTIYHASKFRRHRQVFVRIADILAVLGRQPAFPLDLVHELLEVIASYNGANVFATESFKDLALSGLAANPAFDEEVLRSIAAVHQPEGRSSGPLTHVGFASNLSCPKDMLDYIWARLFPAKPCEGYPKRSDERAEVMVGFASNPTTTPERLLHLATDVRSGCYELFLALANNPSLPPEGFQLLAAKNKDEGSRRVDHNNVAIAIAQNPSFPVDLVAEYVDFIRGNSRYLELNCYSALYDRFPEVMDGLLSEVELKAVLLFTEGVPHVPLKGTGFLELVPVLKDCLNRDVLARDLGVPSEDILVDAYIFAWYCSDLATGEFYHGYLREEGKGKGYLSFYTGLDGHKEANWTRVVEGLASKRHPQETRHQGVLRVCHAIMCGMIGFYSISPEESLFAVTVNPDHSGLSHHFAIVQIEQKNYY